MEYGIWIFRDDEFLGPVYADPSRDELEEPGLWQFIREHVLEAFEGDGPRFETEVHDDWRFGWKLHARTGMSFVVAVHGEVTVSDLKQFISDLTQRYMDEVDDARFPDIGGVADIVVDVIPPWAAPGLRPASAACRTAVMRFLWAAAATRPQVWETAFSL